MMNTQHSWQLAMPVALNFEHAMRRGGAHYFDNCLLEEQQQQYARRICLADSEK